MVTKPTAVYDSVEALYDTVFIAIEIGMNVKESLYDFAEVMPVLDMIASENYRDHIEDMIDTLLFDDCRVFWKATGIESEDS